VAPAESPKAVPGWATVSRAPSGPLALANNEAGRTEAERVAADGVRNAERVPTDAMGPDDSMRTGGGRSRNGARRPRSFSRTGAGDGSRPLAAAFPRVLARARSELPPARSNALRAEELPVVRR